MIYKEVFACYPDDDIKRLSDIRSFMKGGNLEKYDELRGLIRGNVVEYPLRFLERESLNLRITQKEYLIPTSFATWERVKKKDLYYIFYLDIKK